MIRAPDIFITALALVGIPMAPAAVLRLGPEERVQAAGGSITVLGYSVPSFVDWNGDGLRDLVVGEGSGSYPGKIRIYLNAGTSAAPQFSTFSYVQSNGVDLALSGSG
jgi:hypothetical protein